MIEQSELIKGARVEWTSQAGGITAKKSGKIVAFVPRKQPLPTSLLTGEYCVHGVACSSTVDRYLILLDGKSIGERTVSVRTKKNDYYLPVASVVRNGTLLSRAPATPSVGDAPETEAAAL